MKRQMISAVCIFAFVFVGSTGLASAQTNYAVGQSYTSDPALTSTSAWWLGENPPYTKFTNGSSAWAWGEVSGWQGSDAVAAVTLEIDLGSVHSDIHSVTVDQFISVSSGVQGAHDIRVSGSLDGSAFTDWGSMNIPYDYTNHPEQTWSSIYKNVSYTNYAQGQSYTVTPALTSTGAFWLGEDPPYTTWTDGFSQWAGWSARGWQGSDNVGSATIVIDLGSVHGDIESVTVDQMVSVSSGVRGATGIQVSGSLDGVAFTEWGSMIVPFDHTNNPEQAWTGAWLGTPMSARYVQIVINWDPAWLGSHKLLQEIAVNGNPIAVPLSARYVRLNILWDSDGSHKLLQEISVWGGGSGIEDWENY